MVEHGNGPEPALINGTFPDGLRVSPSQERVSSGQPMHKARQSAILHWPQQKVPVIGHQAVREYSHGVKITRRRYELLERVKIGGAVKQRSLSGSAVAHVINVSHG